MSYEQGDARRIYTYIVTHDGGFAPNPFHGWCTLACCKPAIRRTAVEGNWIIGITSAKHGDPRRVVYAMQVDEVLGFEEYWADRRFRQKRPRWNEEERTIAAVGDNCFAPRGDGEYLQLPCCHNRRSRGRLRHVDDDRDLRGTNVLVSQHFAYFGESAEPLPDDLAFAIPGRGHMVNFTDEQHAKLLAFVRGLRRGVHGLPSGLAAERRLRRRPGTCRP